MTANGYKVPFRVDENVLELVVTAAQLSKYTKNHWIVHLIKRVNLRYMNYISVFLEEERGIKQNKINTRPVFTALY